MGLLAWLRGDDLGPDVENRDYSISDPDLAELLSNGGTAASVAGVPVTESSSLGLTAVFRAVALISGAVAGLPMKVYRDTAEGTRERATSPLFDNPDGPGGMTPYEWKELVMVHLLLHGNAFLAHVYGGGGQLLSLQPIHPSAVAVKVPVSAEEQARWAPWRRYYVLSLLDGSTVELSPMDLTHIVGPSTDGVRGLSAIEAQRQAISCGLAGDRAAAKMFGNGLLLGGLVSGDETLTEEDAKEALAALKAKTSGTDHASSLAFVNANLKFTPWAIPPREAQFIESRTHQIEEVARIFGVPPHLLGLTEKQTSWGTGVAEQNRGLARFTLSTWTTRIEQRLSRLLPAARFVEFDYSGFLQPAPEQEIPLLIAQVEAGLLTINEARAIRNLAPLDGGDQLGAGDVDDQAVDVEEGAE